MSSKNKEQYKSGRGAQINTVNRFLKIARSVADSGNIDEEEESGLKTKYIEQEVKSIVNKVLSPDVRMEYSMNPYAGCEHGCIYCFARNVHEYWGFSAGLDFEQNIIVKKNAAELLKKFLRNPNWDATPIMLSGNTDCYQPGEAKYRLTRSLLEVCNNFNQPVGIITKNAGILRDKDILAELASKQLVSVIVSITSMDESLRRLMEPRTTTATRKFEIIAELSKAGVRTGVMLGPMIPGLNDHEMHRIIKTAAEAGATYSSYTFIRLNGAIKFLFHDWVFKNFPHKANKIWHLIEQGHQGRVNDSRWGVRLKGEGPLAQLIAQQHKKYCNLYGLNKDNWEANRLLFNKNPVQGQLFS